MNIVVCIKQVPDSAEVRINPETNTLITGRRAYHNKPIRYARNRGRAADKGNDKRQGHGNNNGASAGRVCLERGYINGS